jgi:regulator of sigma E protease
MTDLIQSAITVVLFIFILGVLVVIHELGHFVTARLANVRVLEFGIGFPPRARVLRNRGETLYTLNWLPIGGFVKLEGEDGNTRDDPRSFAAQPLATRLLILVAGVVMNVVLAFVIFTGIALGGDPTLGIRVLEVQPDSPGASAGLVPGDVIARLDGQIYSAFGDGALVLDLRERAGQTVRLGIEHADGTVSEVTLTLRDRAAIEAGRGAVGISQEIATTRSSVTYSPGAAVRIGAERTIEALGLIVGGLGELGDAIINRPTEPPPASGPIGIAVAIGDIFWQLGPIITLYVAGLLSANLAVVNILPIPPFDGGRMLLITLKRFFGERISLRAERLTILVGFVFLAAFMIWITGFDFARLLGQ